MDNEQFRKHGHELVDWLADYFENIEDYPVKSRVKPGEIKSKLSSSPPNNGENMEDIFADFQKHILPGITHWQHPNFYAYFPANNSPPSVLGEFLASGLGVLGMVWQTSPSATELEEVVMDWLRQLLGLSDSFTGVIQDNASTSTLCSLLTAREKSNNFKSNDQGIENCLTVYASEEAHSSIEKGVKIAGFGKNNLRYIPTDENFSMRVDKLAEQIEKDKQSGYQPACVIATVGTTSSTAIDLVPAIGELCQSQNIWLHVDAAFAGSAAIIDDKKYLLNGVEYADTCVINPHKWLYTNFDCSAFYVKDPALLKNTLSILPEYLKTSVDEEVKNFRDWGIQLGRGFRSLKLWFVLRSYGKQGLQELIEHHLNLAQNFKKWIQNHQHFELMAPVPVSLVCFRVSNGSLSENELNDLNQKLLERINATGKAFLSHTTLNGKFVLRMAIGQRTTELEHIEKTWDIIKSEANKLLQSF